MIWPRVVDWFRRRRLDRDLDTQLAYHLDALEAEGRTQGLSPEDARASARRAMGGVIQVKEAYRDQLTLPVVDAVVDSLRQDVRDALRAMRHNVTFTVVVILTLAVGIGANTAVFSVLNSILFKPLSYPRAEELVALKQIAPGAVGSRTSAGLDLSPSMYVTYAEQNRTFQSLGVWTTTISTVTGAGEPEQVRVVLVSDGVLQALNVPPAVGRWLSAQDQVGATRPPPSVFTATTTIMLGYGYWQRRFGGDPAVVGHTITVDARPKQVVGVMPSGFKIGTAEPDIIWPAGFDRGRLTLAGFNYQGVARLRPGSTIAQANADIARMVPIWMTSWSDGPAATSRSYETWNISPALRPLKQDIVGSVTDVLWVVMATVALVMLIACANVANLLLVRTEVRHRELSVRAALGAGRGRLVRSLLVESGVLGLLGGAAGIALAFIGVRVLRAIGPANLPRLNEIALDARTFGFAAALSLVASVVFGLMPALKYTGPRIASALASVGRTSSANREHLRTRNVLVVVQVAIALVLLVSAGLMIRTFEAIRTVDPGFTDPEHLQIVRMFIAASMAPEAERVTRLQQAIQDKLSSIPGVTTASFGSAMPMEGFGANLGVVNTGIVRSDDHPDPSRTPALRLFKYVAPGFFQTGGTRVVAGRDLTWTEIYGLRPVVLISENLARELWGSANVAVGKRLRQNPAMPAQEVVGVVEDVRENGVYQPAPATVYWPALSGFVNGTVVRPNAVRQVTFVMRSQSSGTEGFLNQIRQAVWAVNPGLPVSPRTMREVYDESLARTSFTLVMLAIAASMALLLGVVGIYGVMAYAVSQRTRELGIRAALGARRGELSGMFVRQSLKLSGIGITMGLIAAAILTRVMTTLLYGISALDPITYATVPILLVGVTILAGYVPARRAAGVNPVEALKVE